MVSGPVSAALEAATPSTPEERQAHADAPPAVSTAGGGPAAENESGADAAPQDAAADDAVQRLLRIEDRALLRPEAAAEEFRALAEELPEESPLRRELLGLAGRYFANAERFDEARALIEELVARQARLQDGSDLAAEGIRLRLQTVDADWKTSLQKAQALTPRVDAELGARERLRHWYNLAGGRAAAGDLGDALLAYEEVDRLAAEVDHPSWTATVRSAQATVLSQFGQQARAEALAREAVGIAERYGDALLLSDVYTTLGIVLDEGGDSEGFLASMQRAIEYTREAGAEDGLPVLLGNIAHYYLVREQYAAAEQAAQEALAAAEAVDDEGGRSLARINLGLARIGLGQVEDGKALVQLGIDHEVAEGLTTDLALTYAELGAALERAGDAAGAVASYHATRRLQDRIFREDQQRAVLALQEEYEARRREREIEQLNAQNAREAAELERRQLQQWLWALLALLLGAVLVLLALGLRRLRISNRSLAGLNAQLRLQSERDPLTGLANRRHVQAVIQHTSSERAFRGSLMLIDLDHFKAINDRHGHAVGDTVLVETGRRLRALCRGTDLAARWGGEEFLLVLDWLDPEHARTLAGRLLSELGRPVEVEGVRIPLTASVGYAAIPLAPAEFSMSFEQAMRLVDAALYLAKLRGRHRAVGLRWLREASPSALEALLADLEHAEALGRVGLDIVVGEDT